MLAISSSFLSGIFDGIKNIIKIVGNIGNILTGFFQSIMGIIYSIFYYLFMSVCQISTFAEMLFKKFAGIDTMVTNDGSVKDIVTIFISSNEVWGLFVSIIVLSIILLFLFTFIAIIKSEFSLDVKGSAKGPIIARALKSLAMFIVVPTVSVMGIYAVNALTQTINGMFRNGNEVSISNQIFYVSAYNANRARQDSDNFKTYITGGTVKGLLGDEYKLDSNTKNRDGGTFNNPDTVAYEIDIAFRGNRKASGDNWVTLDPLSAIDANISVDSMLTQYTIYLSDYFSPWNVGTVSYYYRLADFDYLLGLATSIYMALMLVFMSASLIKRVFEITILLLLAPPLISMAPLDGGSASKKWQGEFIKRVIAIIGPVFAINMYFVLVPVFMSITLFSGGLNIGGVTASAGMPSTVSAINISTIAASPVQALIPGYQLYDSIFQLLTLCVGMQVVKQASALLSNLLGIGDLVKESNEAKKKTLDAAAKTAMLVATGGASVGAMFKQGASKSALNSAAAENTRIQNDPNATSAQKQEALRKLDSAQKQYDHDKKLKTEKLEAFAEQAAPGIFKGYKGVKDTIKDSGKTKEDKSIDDAKKAESAKTKALEKIEKEKQEKQSRDFALAALDDDSFNKIRNSADDDLRTAQGNHQTAQQNVRQARRDVRSARQGVSSARSALNAAVAHRDSLVSIDPATGAVTHASGYDAADAAVGNASATLASAEQRLTNAVETLNTRKAEERSARTELDVAQAHVDSLQSKGQLSTDIVTGKVKGSENGERVEQDVAMLSAKGEANYNKAKADETRKSNVDKKVQELSEEQEAKQKLESATNVDGEVDAALDRNSLGDAVQQGIEESLSALKNAIKEAIQSGKLRVDGVADIKTQLRKQAQLAAKEKAQGRSDEDIAQILKDGLDSIRDSLKKD